MNFDLPESDIPPSCRTLPRDKKGYPVPWFVCDPEPGQEPDLRVADGRKREGAWKKGLCWVCGVPLGKFRVFVGGGLSAVNGAFSDWCCHEACAVFSCKACPFLAGKMTRRSGRDYPEGITELPGFVAEQIPVNVLYYVQGKVKRSPDGHFLAGPPSRLRYFRRGHEINVTEAVPLLAQYARGMKAPEFMVRELESLLE